jgi:hypothetical protein
VFLFYFSDYFWYKLKATMKQFAFVCFLMFTCLSFSQPANDNCNTATPINNISSCIPVSGTLNGATASPVANTCVGNANDDVWFSFTATSSQTDLKLSNFSSSGLDVAFSVYSGSCASLGTPILCSDPNTASATGLTPGHTYYVRVWSVSAAPQTSTFNICGTAMTTKCGTPATPNNQDYCYAPAILTAGGGNFSSVTSGQYTNDSPGNLSSIFCGSIENNSWYTFVQGSGTSATFNFTVSGCTDGVQAQVYDVTTDANGCCTNFTSMSNCWNPDNADPGTVTANGLITGHTYYLMVDGQAGAVCNFTVTNWSATGILAVQLVDFYGVSMPGENILRWKTKSETESDYFEVQRSFDGKIFVPLGKVEAAGTSNDPHDYTYVDDAIRVGEVYYRLKQVDNDGYAQFSDPVLLKRSAQGNGIISVYPNPAEDLLHVEFNQETSNQGEILVELISIEGKVIETRSIQNGGFHQLTFELGELEKGMYFIRCTNDRLNSQKSFVKR